jgi:ketosteroid isomerase-like protein
MNALVVALALAAQTGAAAPAPQARPEIATELQRGVDAYNAQNIAYYQSSLSPDVVYIADDGGLFVGKERVVGLFTRIFGRTPKPRLEVSEVVTGGSGDVAWARVHWTLSDIEKARPGIATVIFVKSGGKWQTASIQNTKVAHPMRPARPAGASMPSASPAPPVHQH